MAKEDNSAELKEKAATFVGLMSEYIYEVAESMGGNRNLSSMASHVATIFMAKISRECLHAAGCDDLLEWADNAPLPDGFDFSPNRKGEDG